MPGAEPARRTDFICALAVGAAAMATLHYVQSQGWTLAEVVLFSGGALVGVWAKSSPWKLWLACAAPSVSTVVTSRCDPAGRAPDDVALLPVAIVFLAFSYGAFTSFFAAGLVAGRSAAQRASSGHALLSQVGLPCAAGAATPIAILSMAKAFGEKQAIDGPWPLLIVIASCLLLGALARLIGDRTTSPARIVGVAVGVNIGLAGWMCTPEPTNLTPPFLGVLAIATVASTWAGAKVALALGTRSAPG